MPVLRTETTRLAPLTPLAPRLSMTASGNARSGGEDMPTWLWILLIVLLVLALTGGIGYRRR